MDCMSILDRPLDRIAASRRGGRIARWRDAMGRRASAAAEAQGTQEELRELRALTNRAIEVAHDISLPARLLAFMSWLELHPPGDEGPLISVVLATRDRPQLLSRAIDSVVGQRYRRWELIVVDDGTAPETREAVEAANDERLRLVDGPRKGLSSARNAGLATLTGEIVCYCDDDNIMHPGWLHAVAEVFAGHDGVEVAYGVSIAERKPSGDLPPEESWPFFWQLPWSRRTLLEENVTDAGALAHLSRLEDAGFDEGLTTGEDWDLLLRLTTNREALAIPAISHAYTMSGEDRMSDDAEHRAGLERIRRRYAEG